jgi:hypothetical protein
MAKKIISFGDGVADLNVQSRSSLDKLGKQQKASGRIEPNPEYKSMALPLQHPRIRQGQLEVCGSVPRPIHTLIVSSSLYGTDKCNEKQYVTIMKGVIVRKKV